MIQDDIYPSPNPYPSHTSHSTTPPSPSSSHSPAARCEIYGSGELVRVKKGHLRGKTGNISAFIPGGVYFIRTVSEPHVVVSTALEGPFLSDELERLSS